MALLRWAIPLFGLGLAAFWLPPASPDWLLTAWAAFQTYCHARQL